MLWAFHYYIYNFIFLGGPDQREPSTALHGASSRLCRPNERYSSTGTYEAASTLSLAGTLPRSFPAILP